MSGNQDTLFFRIFSIVLGALVVFTFAIMVLANSISPQLDAALDPLVMDVMQVQLGPVGQSRVAQ